MASSLKTGLALEYSLVAKCYGLTLFWYPKTLLTWTQSLKYLKISLQVASSNKNLAPP